MHVEAKDYDGKFTRWVDLNGEEPLWEASLSQLGITVYADTAEEATQRLADAVQKVTDRCKDPERSCNHALMTNKPKGVDLGKAHESHGES